MSAKKQPTELKAANLVAIDLNAAKNDDFSLDDNLEFWMTNLPPVLRSISIINLAIPGSHDSFTNNITKDSKVAPDAQKILQDLKFLGPILTYFMARWSRTQAYSATEQLMNGIRYFDLRLATKEGTDQLYFVHGLYSSEVALVFDEIAKFLEAHPQEFIILDCQHFYAFKPADHQRLMQMMEQLFGPKLLPYTSRMDHLTLEYLTSQFHYQVIVIYRSEERRFGQPLLWPPSSFPNPWADTDVISRLIPDLNEYLKHRDMDKGFISQCILTPSVSFVVTHLCSTLLETCVLPLEQVKFEWLADQLPGPGRLNIVIADFVDLNENQFIREVINLNRKLAVNDRQLSVRSKSTNTVSTVVSLTPVD